MNYYVIRGTDRKIVKTFESLHGILEYSRDHAVELVELCEHERVLRVTWKNGSTTTIRSADAKRMRRWVLAQKAFKGATFKLNAR